MKKTLAIVLALILALTAAAASAEAQPDVLSSLKTAGDVHQLILSIQEKSEYGTTFEYLDWGVASQVVTLDGKIYRFITDGGETAKKKYSEAYQAEDFSAALNEAEAYLYSLPITTVEELTAQPLSQEELDAWVGKPLGDLYAAGWTESGSGMGDPYVVMNLNYGFFTYDVQIDIPGESYDYDKTDEYAKANIVSLKYVGLCGNCVNPEYQADGTYVPSEEPTESGLLAGLGGEGGAGLMSMLSGLLNSVTNEAGELDRDAIVNVVSPYIPDKEKEIGELVDLVLPLLQSIPQAETAAPEETVQPEETAQPDGTASQEETAPQSGK